MLIWVNQLGDFGLLQMSFPFILLPPASLAHILSGVSFV